MTVRFLSGGESHGRGLVLIIEGFPAGLSLSEKTIVHELSRRRRGYGRGPRMKLEKDRLVAFSGLRSGRTTGSPLSFVIENTEWEKWQDILDPWKSTNQDGESVCVTRPRPGHADLAGAFKYGHRDIRNVLERASARSTAGWTVAGTVARILLEKLGVSIRSAVTSIGGIRLSSPLSEQDWARASSSDLGCFREEDKIEITKKIKESAEEGDTLGGTFVLSAVGLPPGIGSYSEWDRRLDGRLSGAIMSIPAIKGVEIGKGFQLADMPGSEVHDEIMPFGKGWKHTSNNAGGIEGGMTNGEEVLVSVAMKPIPTLKKPLSSLDIETGEAVQAAFERSDTCAVPAACIVGEAMMAWVLISAITEQFGGDTVAEISQRWKDYIAGTKGFING